MKWVSKGKKKKYTYKRFFHSFSYALSGIVSAFTTEPNLVIEILCGILALLLGFYLQISKMEFLIVILLIGFIISLEMVNTALEYTVDMAMPVVHPLAKCAKDAASGALLVASICAIVIGGIIYLPRIIEFVKNF